MRRPSGITLTTAFMSLALIATVPLILAGRMGLPWSETEELALYALHSLLHGLMALVIVCALGMALWFYFHGRNWARWTVIVLCLICFIPLYGMPDRVGSSHIRMAIIFYRAAVAVLTILYNLTPSARRWFASKPSLEE